MSTISQFTRSATRTLAAIAVVGLLACGGGDGAVGVRWQWQWRQRTAAWVRGRSGAVRHAARAGRLAGFEEVRLGRHPAHYAQANPSARVECAAQECQGSLNNSRPDGGKL